MNLQGDLTAAGSPESEFPSACECATSCCNFTARFVPTLGACRANLGSANLGTTTFCIASEDEIASDAGLRYERFQQQCRKLNGPAVGATRYDLVNAAAVILQVFLRRNAKAEFKAMHAAYINHHF
jgi:hypothetical protein